MRALSALDPNEGHLGSLQSSPGGSAVVLPPTPWGLQLLLASLPRTGLWHRSARAAPYHACRRGGGRVLEGRSRGSPAARGSYCRQLSPFQSMQSLGGGRSPAGCALLHPAAPLQAERGGIGEVPADGSCSRRCPGLQVWSHQLQKRSPAGPGCSAASWGRRNLGQNPRGFGFF